MKFTMPKASKKSLEKLLEYLGDTKNYSEYYSGNRAEDFKKCCDIESEWCWKYADLLLRGLKKRKLGYYCEDPVQYNKDYYEANKDKLAAYYEANREKILEQKKDYREAKKAAGYRRRKNPITGKREWVFVGLPGTKITEVA